MNNRTKKIWYQNKYAMRALWVSLFGLSNVLASTVLYNACAEKSRFSPRMCELMRLLGLLVMFVLLLQEMMVGRDILPLAWTAALTVAVAMARPSTVVLSG